MARISTYPLDDNIGLNDILFGSENNGIGSNGKPVYVTKNYRIGDLSNFFGLSGDTVALNTNKLSSLATFNTDGSVASLQNATVSLINTATTAAGFATSSSVTAVNSRVDIILGSGGSSVSEAFANQVFTTTTNSDFAAATDVTELKSQFTYSGSDINGLASGTTISTAIATAETSAVSTANAARATAETALVATISKVFRQTSAPAVTEPVNSIWYDTDDNNKPYVLVAGSPRVWTAVNDPTLATSASVTTVSDAVALVNGKLSARYGIKVATGNVFAGMELMSNSDATGAVSDIIFTATNFKIKTIDGSGNVSPVAPFTVSGANGSNVVSIDGSLKIGNTSLTDVTTKANSATQSSDHASIQAGTTAANVGLANVVNSNFDANGNVIGGAIGGTTINSTKIFQGTGTFGNANTGFYLDNGGNFSLRDKLVFDGSTGNLSIAGAISATSGSIASSVTIGGTAASTVASGAASGATANQTSTADIRAVGAATSGTIAGISISGSELYQGTGTFGNANTGFYLGSNGTFSLKDKLSWDGTTLTINGNGTFSGDISAASGTFTGGVSGTGYTLNNSGLSLTNASSSISLGNSVVLNSSGLSGTGFALTSAGIASTSGTIGGFSIGSAAISTSNKTTLADNDAGVYIGTDGIALGTNSPFKVTAAGALTAASGTIGALSVTSTQLYVDNSSVSGGPNWSNENTRFFINNTGHFSLTDQFTYNPTLNRITINANSTFAGALQAASGNFSGEITAATGTIGGWGITGSGLEAETGLVDIDSNGSITVFEGTTPRIEINSNTSVSDPLITSALSGASVNSTLVSTTLSSSNTSVFLNSLGSIDIQTNATRNNITYFYGNASSLTTSTLQGENSSYSISVESYSMTLTKDDVIFSGSIGYSFGIAFFTSSSDTSSPFHVSSATAKSLTVSNSSSTNTLDGGAVTITGSFTWPSQATVYVRGYIKSVVVDGTTTQVTGETGTTVTAAVTSPKANVDTSDILTAITKSEFTSGGFLVAKNSNSYFRLDRNAQDSGQSTAFCHFFGNVNHHRGAYRIIHDTTGQADTNAFISKKTAQSYANQGGHFIVFQSAKSDGSQDNALLVYADGDVVNRNNSYTQYSDRTLKENIVDATSKLDDIKKVKVRNFNFIGDENKQIGVIAQEIEEIWPNLVKSIKVPDPESEDDSNKKDKVKLFKYSVLVPILIKGMQEQQELIESQKTLIEDLTARVTALES